MHQAMTKHMDYKTLIPSDIALVNCGLGCIIDLTQGSIANQCLLFSKEDWSQIKTLFSKSPIDNNFIETRPTLRKIDKLFKNSHDMEECYWNSKSYQQKASNSKEKIGYELISIIIDKMIKHATIFSISKPSPSEADIMIKIGADIFVVLFYNTGIYIRWGEKGLITGDTERVMFNLDAKLVLIYDENEYPVSCMKFAPYSGPKKIKSDRSKLLVEAEALYNQTMDLNVDEENESILKIVKFRYDQQCVTLAKEMTEELDKDWAFFPQLRFETSRIFAGCISLSRPTALLLQQLTNLHFQKHNRKTER